jgi:uncharacterized protein YdhG (YjbR/CyaY superfamily)
MYKPKVTSIEEYIDIAPEIAKEKLIRIREILRKVAPESKESIKWGNPVMEEKRILFAFAAFKDHINFMPTSSSMEPFGEELKAFKTGKGTIQFTYDKPLPEDLLLRIATYRARDVRENDAKWM